MTAFALNEWDSKQSGGVEWRQKLDMQVSPTPWQPWQQLWLQPRAHYCSTLVLLLLVIRFSLWLHDEHLYTLYIRSGFAGRW